MKPKPESWNSATPESQGGVRRSLTRAGLQLGLGHVVSGALSSMPGGGASSRGAAQTRMRALLNQDRALLSHRACGSALLLDEDAAAEAPAIPGKQTRGAAQTRMRELLNQDRALLALRRAGGGQIDDADDADDDFAAPRRVEGDKAGRETEQGAAHAPTGVFQAATTLSASAETITEAVSVGVANNVVSVASVARGSCVGAMTTTSFASEPTPEPAPAAAAPVPVATPAADPIPLAAQAQVAARPSAADAAPAPVPASSESAADPIRTRSMAKLLALQGYRERALSIYEELISAEPDNVELRAEADRLRN